MAPTRFLMIEDSQSIVAPVRAILQEQGVDLTVVMSVGELRAFGHDVAQFRLILVDGYLSPGRWQGPVDTADFVRGVRQQGYVGPMVAISSVPEANQELMAAGCSEALEDKILIYDFVTTFVQEITKRAS